MRKIFVILFCLILGFNYDSFTQGCVAVRSSGGFCTAELAEQQHADSALGSWYLFVNNRYFRSFRHFVGTKEQPQRVEQGTEVVNHTYNLDLTLVRNLKGGWSVAMNLPVSSNVRSSLYEHGGNNGGKNARHSTHSFGIGDIRFTVYKWLIDPAVARRGNIQVGLGLKLPTGDYRYQDYFYKNDSVKVLGPVDQSIQLGDGGTGFSTELNGYYNFNRRFSVYGNFYYLFNPREQNGVSTARGGTPSASSIAYGSDVMSVPDQYMIRGGVNVNLRPVVLSLGIRDECVPVHDLIGGSNGFRRPGYIVSAEPGVTWYLKKAFVYAYVPVALVRSRTQSVPDKIRTQLTGVYAQGDAAFADYLVNIGFAVKF